MFSLEVSRMEDRQTSAKQHLSQGAVQNNMWS